MKKYLIQTVILIFLTSFLLMGIGCKTTEVTETTSASVSTTASDSGVSQDDMPKGEGKIYYLAPEMFGVIQPQYILRNEENGKKLGYEVVSLNPNNQPPEQIRQFDDAIAQKPKAIILNSVDASTVTASIDKARSEGIPVLVLDRLVPNTKVDFSSVLGTIKMGYMGAEECIKLLKEKYGEAKGTILEVMGHSGDNYTVTIDQGFKEIMKDYPNVKLIIKDTPGWDTNNTVNIVTDQVTTNKDIDIIFIHWDARVPWIFPVLEAQGYKPGDIKIVGTDGEPDGLACIKSGWIQATISYPLYSEINGIWMFMDEVIAKEEIKPGKYMDLGVEVEVVNETWGPTLYVPGYVVTKDNVDSPDLWANNIPPETTE